MEDKELRQDILVFLFEQELKVGDSDVIEWSVERIIEIVKKHT